MKKIVYVILFCSLVFVQVKAQNMKGFVEETLAISEDLKEMSQQIKSLKRNYNFKSRKGKKTIATKLMYGFNDIAKKSGRALTLFDEIKKELKIDGKDDLNYRCNEIRDILSSVDDNASNASGACIRFYNKPRKLDQYSYNDLMSKFNSIHKKMVELTKKIDLILEINEWVNSKNK